MKSLKSYILRYWYVYIIAIVTMILSIILDVISPRIIKSIIDDVIVGGNTDILMRLLAIIIGIGIGRAVFQYVKEFTFDIVSIRIACDIRRDVFKHIEKLSMSFFDKNNTGELMARVKDDVDKIWDGIGYIGMLAIEGTIHTVMVIYCMLQINVKLTLIPLAVMPIIAYTAIKLESKLSKVYDDISEETAQLNTVAQENLAGVRTVKAFARENFEIEKFKKHNRRFYKLNVKQANIMAKYDPNISFITKILLIAVVIIGGVLVVNDEITLGELGAFVEYSNKIIWPMEVIGWLGNGIASAFASYKKIRNVCDEESEILEPESPVSADNIEGKIEFKNVSFEVAGKTVLKDINFTLEKGKTIGIMGMTGSGKSSIVNLIQRFYDVTDGCIMIDGVDIRKYSLKDLRNITSVVMQDVFLFSDTINENIKKGNRKRITPEQIKNAASSAKADDFVESLSSKYDTIIGERGVGLSGGQKQRLSIARAFAKNAPVLIFDDSTSALDMETEYNIQQELNKKKDLSKLVIAHRISAVKDADEIIILENGTIAERGSHDELLAKKGLYYDTYIAQYANYVS